MTPPLRGGGVIGQLLLVATGLAIGPAHGGAPSGFLRDLIDVVVGINLVVAFVNLLPVAPLDGALAWRYFRLNWRTDKAPCERARPTSIKRDVDRTR